MGEMADFALQEIEKQYEHYEKYKDAPLHEQYDEGLIDEHGITNGTPWGTPTPHVPSSKGRR